VRELINALERAMLLCRGVKITLDVLPAEVRESGGSGAGSAAPEPRAEPWLGATIKEVRDAAVARAEREYLRALLADTGGVLHETARRAGIGPRALYDRMKRYGLRQEDFQRA
jgi:DNA-binding NtrC family response regulator